MSSLQTLSAAILISLAFSIAPSFADDDGPSQAEQQAEQQVKADTDTLTAEQAQLLNYQQQAKWYEQFAQKRLQHADVEKAVVENRLRTLETWQVKNPKADPKGTVAHEVKALRAWLNDEAAKRKQIELTRERWKTAIENTTSQTQQTKYQLDVDQANVDKQKQLDKVKANIQAENPKPAPPQVQQNTILIPGWETEQGNIPLLLGPGGGSEAKP